MYELKNSNGEGLKKKVNINRLKRFIQRNPALKRKLSDSAVSSPTDKKRTGPKENADVSSGAKLSWIKIDGFPLSLWRIKTLITHL